MERMSVTRLMFLILPAPMTSRAPDNLANQSADSEGGVLASTADSKTKSTNRDPPKVVAQYFKRSVCDNQLNELCNAFAQLGCPQANCKKLHRNAAFSWQYRESNR